MTLYETHHDVLFPSEDDILERVSPSFRGTFSEDGCPNLTEVAIPPRSDGLRTLPSIEVPEYVVNAKEMHEWMMRSPSIAFFLLLTETGRYTKHTYQPNLNHRELDMAFWYSIG